MVLGLGLKFSRPHGKGAEEDDQWYIPYNGPYEPPRTSSHRARPRDSWGDPVGDKDDGLRPTLGNKKLEQGVGGEQDEHLSHDKVNTPLPEGRASKDRTTSFTSGRTGSGSVDPTRGNVVTQRRSTVSSGQRQPAPAYPYAEANGGVGESPVPSIPAKDPLHPGRLNIGGIFSFGSSNRKGLPSPTTPTEKDRHKISMRKSRPARLNTANTTSSSSSGSSSPNKLANPDPDVSASSKVDEDDYYNVYYSALLKGSGPEVSHHNPSFGVNPRTAPRPGSGSTISHQEIASHSIHPYAYSSPKQYFDSSNPDTDPLLQDAPKLTFNSPAKPSHLKTSAVKGLGVQQPKNSSSTPNSQPPKRGIERWLSAETWCDAILFPRPRLKVKEEHSSGQIVSPPTTPVTGEHFSKLQENVPSPAYQSRVLAHSHSLMNLSPSKKHQPSLVPTNSTARENGEKPPRPKSFAQDDLALINPVLSLEKVLEEGAALEAQRRQWQIQAASSIGNARVRKLSRTRSKSLTQKGRIGGHRSQTSLDYLATRACLGAQNLTPTIVTPRSQTTYFSGGSTTGRVSHSHSSSFAKSKSSKSHSRGPSRSDSSKSGSKMKVVPNSEMDNKLLDLEGTLKRDHTQGLRAPESTLSADNNHPRISPTPSGGSDSRMGIAISTPPLVDEVLDRDSIRMPSHPYAQALPPPSESYAAGAERHEPPVGYLGPQPPAASNQIFISTHPYALALETEDDVGFIGQGRDDSKARPQSKMWAQLSPGVVREILPTDIQYSPFLHERPDLEDADRADLVGLGEALAYPRDGRESAFGTNDGHVVQHYRSSISPLGAHIQQPDHQPLRDRKHYVHREPVRYDASQPVYVQHNKNLSDYSTPVKNADHLQIPNTESRPSPSSGATSGTPSPQPSPRSLGSPNDLDSYHDLFYKPQITQPPSLLGGDDQVFGTSGSGQLSGEVALHRRRTGSGLTSLARQLSEEMEQLEQSNSQYSFSSSSGRPGKRRPADGGLEFVFEDGPRSASPLGDYEDEGDQDSTQIFRPSFRIPQDVNSSTSSLGERMVDHDDDDTTMFRVGVVEAASTPAAEETTRRRSFTGFMSEGPLTIPSPTTLSPTNDMARSSYIVPSPTTLLSPTELTRSSYMTTSTTSRMSNLSDFPIPPMNDVLPRGHLSLISAYRGSDEATLTQQELDALRDTSYPTHPHERRFTFGIDQDAVDVADSLSNPGH